MARMNGDGKRRIVASALKLIARLGPNAASVRAITKAAGVTEAALYRHFASKNELLLEIYRSLVGEMIEEKRAIAAGDAPLRLRFERWIRVSYESFDHDRAAFSFVLLTEHRFPKSARGVTTSQGRIFMEMYAAAARRGEARNMPAELAMSHFTGVMLNIPRLINAGRLKGPARQYASGVTDAVCRLLLRRDGRG